MENPIGAIAIAVTILTVSGAALCWAQGTETPEGFIDHGIAAAISESRGAIATADADGNPIILAMSLDMYKGAARTSLLVIDSRTGETEQYWYTKQEASSPANYCLMVSSKQLFYIMLGDVFLEFDIGQRKWTFAKDMQLGTAMSLVEGEDGTIYAGTYPQSHLLAFDPKTREIVHLGQLDPVEKYPFTLATDPAGWIYAGIGTVRANLVAFNLETKERRQLVKDSDRGTGTGHVREGEDGQIYGQLPGKQWLRLHDGKAAPVDEASPKAPIMNINWGSVFRGFPDGSKLAAFDLPGKTFEVVDADGNKSTLTFDYASGGALITSMIAGPGGKVYGSTCHRFRLFVCDAKTGTVESLGGLRKVGGGNFCGLAVLDDTVYGAAYCGGWLYAFDTTKPWQDSDDENANPRVVAQYNPEITRPRMALAVPEKGAIVYAGFPGYGHVGGSMAFYDVDTGESTLLTNEEILPGHSTITLRYVAAVEGVPARLVGGTSIAAPGGANPVANTGKLYIMDWESRKVVFDMEPVPGASEVNCIEVGPSGKVYGITNTSQLFVFDPATREIVHTQDLREYGGPLRPDQSLLLGPDGRLYALLNRTLVEVSTKDYGIQKVASLPLPTTAGLGICEGRVYYGVGSRVWSYALPEAAGK